MLPMNLPILNILRGQILIPDHQQILGVLIFCPLGEIEGSTNHSLPIDDQNLIMGNVMSRVYLRGDARFGHIRTGSILGG